jgi:DNA-binding transcriptional ArsR family regulator
MVDERICAALSHPLRLELLLQLEHEARSSIELGRVLDLPPNNIAYHMARLRDLGLIELVSSTPRRGATERHYRARVSGWRGVVHSIEEIEIPPPAA